MHAQRILAVLVAVAAAALGACTDEPTAPANAPVLAEDGAPLASGTPRFASTNSAVDGVAVFRRATARYHDIAAALEDGFVQILPCMQSADGSGALGIPFARLDRFDATIDLSEPEILFYEPMRNGRMRLVGGEPVVPIAAWTDSEPPALFGQTFHRNDQHGLYGLHMWIWKHNPEGMFAFWHPRVSCEHAP